MSSGEHPTTFRDLRLKIYLPHPVRDKAEYEKAAQVAEALAGFEQEMNDDQSDYFEATTVYMEEYENVETPSLPGVEILKQLAEANNLTNTALTGSGESKVVSVEPMPLHGN